MPEPDSGPDSTEVPKLPPGWIAQWDSSSRKYYYVQISTGQSTWDLPTTAAPGVVLGSASSTPAQGTPYTPPPAGNMSDNHGESTDRGLGSTAINMLLGGNQKQSSGPGGLVGQIASGLLSGSSNNKPSGGNNDPTAGLLGALGSMFGGGSTSNQNFGYSNAGATGPYTGAEPPAVYVPPKGSGQSQNQSNQGVSAQSYQQPAQTYQQPTQTYQQPQQQHHQSQGYGGDQYNQNQYGGQQTHQYGGGYQQSGGYPGEHAQSQQHGQQGPPPSYQYPQQGGYNSGYGGYNQQW